MEKNRILLLEDDISLIDGLEYSLKKSGFQIQTARSLEEGRRLLSGENGGCGIGDYDLLLLDVSLPDGTGFSLCEEVRRRGSLIPIIFLTAADEETSVIRGLDGGRALYLAVAWATEPFTAQRVCYLVNLITLALLLSLVAGLVWETGGGMLFLLAVLGMALAQVRPALAERRRGRGRNFRVAKPGKSGYNT